MGMDRPHGASDNHESRPAVSERQRQEIIAAVWQRQNEFLENSTDADERWAAGLRVMFDMVDNPNFDTSRPDSQHLRRMLAWACSYTRIKKLERGETLLLETARDVVQEEVNELAETYARTMRFDSLPEKWQMAGQDMVAIIRPDSPR